MKDFPMLKILDFFRPLFELFGVEYQIMRKILVVKLTMDRRRTPTIFNQNNKKTKKDEENGIIKSLGMYVLLSLMLIPLVIFGKSYVYEMSAFFGIVMFLIMTSMISDFSTVLLDVKDKGILLTKPVGKKTITAAKMVHISIYLLLITTSITALPVIVGTFRHGILFLFLAIVELLLVNLFIVVLTAIIYYYILRFFDGEKLKDIINYVQIGLSISITVGYQLVARAFSFVNFDLSFSPTWYHFLIPPIWFGAPFELILNRNTNTFLIGFTILAVIIPIIAIMLYSLMIPSFEKNLQKLSNNSGLNRKKVSKWKNWLSSVFCRNNEEKVFFKFADNMMRNEREFRLKVYPSLGLSFVLPIVFLFNQLQIHSYQHLIVSKSYLTIYMSCLIIPNAISMLKYSGKYKGAWIYKTAPVSNLAPLYSATLKVFIANLYFPVYFILSILFIGIFGMKIIPDLLVVFVSSILYTVICSNYLKGTLPFSESFEDAQQNSGIKILFALLLGGILALIHWGITFIPFGEMIYLVLLMIFTFFSWKRAYHTIWNF
ncbi:hypothetical protein [Bacillus sp. AFS055030]|uniref:hypothetical protein n=1 Tax=Bacillus sp. AFS055030 TaxID=2033507 RepID=UPI000BFB6CB7|nr:hypothetical protein [Bacillus sp. AFS055030]PGL71037.1 hypothetical protein CN925_09270 [Bacillus sp. AFS055030]